MTPAYPDTFYRLFRIAQDLAGLHLASRLSDAQKKYSEVLSHDDITKLSKGDPSGNHKYLDWMCSKAAEEGVDQVVQAVKIFDQYPQLFKIKDIRSYDSTQDISDTFEEAIQDRKKSIEVASGSVPVYPKSGKLSRFYVLTIPNHQAARSYGNGTRWCIASDNSVHYDKYITQGCVFYILFDLFENEKYAIQVLGDDTRDMSEEIIPVSVWEPSDTTLPHGLLRDIVKDEFYPIFRVVASDMPSRANPEGNQPRDLGSGLDRLEQGEQSAFPDQDPDAFLTLLSQNPAHRGNEAKVLLNRAPIPLLQQLWSGRNKIHEKLLPDFMFRLPKSFVNSRLDDLEPREVRLLYKKLPTKYLRKCTEIANMKIIQEMERRLPTPDYHQFIFDCFRSGNSSPALLTSLETSGLIVKPKDIPVDIRYQIITMNSKDAIFADLSGVEKSLREDDPDYIDFEYFRKSRQNADELVDMFANGTVSTYMDNIGKPTFKGTPKEACDHFIELMQSKYKSYHRPLGEGTYEFLRKYSERSDLELRDIIYQYSGEALRRSYIPLVLNKGLERFRGREAGLIKHNLDSLNRISEGDLVALFNTLFFDDEGEFNDDRSIPRSYPPRGIPLAVWERVFSGSKKIYAIQPEISDYILYATFFPTNESVGVFKWMNFSETFRGLIKQEFQKRNKPLEYFQFLVQAFDEAGYAAPISWDEFEYSDRFWSSGADQEVRELVKKNRDKVPYFNSPCFKWVDR